MSDPSTRILNVGEAEHGWRVDRALAALVPTLSREQCKRLIAAGEMLIGNVRVRDPAAKVRTGDVLTLHIPPPAAASAEAEDIPLDILFEDEHLIVVNKPPGLVVHPAAGHGAGTLVNALLHHAGGRLSGIGGVARPGIVHRIDKDTSGLLVVAKTDRAHAGLSAQFAAHDIEREYVAVVARWPKTSQGTIDAPLARSAANRKKMAIVGDGRGKRAVTHYRMERRLGHETALVRCTLETGRTHQIRVHMASIGHPLLGDPAYGRDRASAPWASTVRGLGFVRQALHAEVLGFDHPVTGAHARFSAPLPADLAELIAALAVS